MKYNTDDIFKEGVHQREIELRPELWNKLERRLNEEKNSTKSWRPWLVAASFFFIISLSSLLYLNIDNYHVEDMAIEFAPYFSKDEIANFEKLLIVEDRIFVNLHLG